MMKKISQMVANFLENISIAIAPQITDNELTKMKRQELIFNLKAHQQELSELKQSQENLLNQIGELIKESQNISNGNLSIRLKVHGCFIGHLADCTNSIVDDLNEAIKYLPSKHPITQKYSLHSLQSLTETPQKTKSV